MYELQTCWRNLQFMFYKVSHKDEGGNLVDLDFWTLLLIPSHIFQGILLGGSEKNNNYFVATFLKISFEHQTAQGNLVTLVHRPPAHSRRLAQQKNSQE